MRSETGQKIFNHSFPGKRYESGGTRRTTYVRSGKKIAMTIAHA